MNNVINPLPQILPATGAADKTVVLEVSCLPAGIKVGDIVMLETLLDAVAASGNNKSVSLLNLVHEGQRLPVEVQTPLPPQMHQVSDRPLPAKVVSATSLQLFLSEPKGEAKPSAGSMSEMPIVKEINKNLPRTLLEPLSGRQVTTRLMQELGFSQQMQTRVQNLLPESAISLKINALASGIENAPTLLQPLKTALTKLAEVLPTGSEPKLAAAQLKVTTELQNLVNSRFIAVPADAAAPQSAQILDSPLGPLKVETPLKLLPEARLEVVVAEVKSGATQTLPPLLQVLDKIFSQPELADIFPRTDQHHLSVLLRGGNEKVSALLKIFEPLRAEPQLALPVMQKLPSFNQGLLSNLHAFYKGASARDAKVWLGTEVVEQLHASGVKGQAALQNLQELTITSLRETPAWRMMEIPLFDGTQLIPLKLAVKKDPEPEHKTPLRKDGGVRFMIETEFSKLGAFQLDGFSLAKERRLDMIVRTSRRQSEDFCTHLINLFKTALYNIDYIGTIAINQKQAFVKTDVEPAAGLAQGVFV